MKAEVLAALKEADGYVSGQALCDALGVSRTAIWKDMKKLKEQGYEIASVPNKGYCLLSAPDVISENELRSIWKAKWAGSEIHFFEKIDSTNTQAKRFAESGSAHGTLVVAEQQETGRGRRGRNWESPSGEGIFMTLLLCPDLIPVQAPMLTLVAALAVAATIRKKLDLPAEIKWPNDIVIGGKKICGILTEMSAEIDYINYVVIGIGINVHNRYFPEEIAQMATSLYLEGGNQVNRASLIEAIWEEFEGYYEQFTKSGDLHELKNEYNSLLANMGKQVKVLDPREPFEGKAMGINEKGELIVDTWEARKLVSTGEVSVRGLYGYV